MTTALPEIKSPLTKARIVGDNVSYEEYSHQLVDRGHPDYIVGRSDLLDILHCPHKWRMGYTTEDTDATEWGQVFEVAVMWPEQAGDHLAICPETYEDAKTHERKPWTFAAKVCKAWREEQGNKLIVKADVWQQAQNAAKFFFGRMPLAKLVRCSKKQVHVEGSYTDKETGITVPLRALVDFVPAVDNPEYGQCLADLKTTRSADPRSWSRDVFQFGLHVQAAFYLDLYNAAAQRESRIEFRHCISESGPPWETACRILSQDFITLGRDRYMKALELYCQCLKTDTWPGYDTDAAGTCWQGWLITEPEPWMVNR